jgi:biopolymer transport protein TolR
MVTAPLLTQGIKVDLPKAAAEPVDTSKSEPLVLSIDQQGQLFLNVGNTPNTAIDAETLTARTGAALQKDPQRQVLVKADQRIAYGRVVEAMVILQAAGATKVGFITEPPAQKPSRS